MIRNKFKIRAKVLRRLAKRAGKLAKRYGKLAGRMYRGA